MTTEDMESQLRERYPGKDWVTSEKLGIGLPMLDGVMFYVPVSSEDELDRAAQHAILITTGTTIE